MFVDTNFCTFVTSDWLVRSKDNLSTKSLGTPVHFTLWPKREKMVVCYQNLNHHPYFGMFWLRCISHPKIVRDPYENRERVPEP